MGIPMKKPSWYSRRLAVLSALVAVAGCTVVSNGDSDPASDRSRGGSEASAQGATEGACWPDQTVRCVCELDEGTRRCDATGRWEGPCNCVAPEGDAGAVQSAVCGDGIVDVGEACDDANVVPGDGCSPSCEPDGRPAQVGACPGQPLHLWPAQELMLTGTKVVRATPFEAGVPDAGACGAQMVTSPDRIYALIPETSGTLRLTLNASVPTSVSIRSSCAVGAGELTCDLAKASTKLVRTLAVQAGKTYWLVIKPRQGGATATYSLAIGL
ncbi:MAG: hypothetical protein JST00_35675 [Deltaproteobacteria bacterium]|nr:hypothetical protein [Deltaproteobacteria bacterium]